jgi:anti-anti-sigma factor
MFLPVTESGVDMGVFEVRIEGNAHVMVRGELDMRTGPQLVSAVESLAGTEVQRVVIDLSRVTFMDSSGVSGLLLAKAKLDVDGTVLVLREVSTQVEAVLRMCGLESEFVREARGS